MADLAAAMERAQSRAAVLQSLQNSYGSEAKVPPSVANSSKKLNGKGGTDQSNRNNGTNDKNTMNEVIDVLVETISDPSMRAKQFFKDALRGKAIVVENVKAQLDASKASKRIELAGKRKKTMSNRAMKKLKIADPAVLPSDNEVRSLHNLWWEYSLQMIGNCHSEAQLQARIQSMEHTGARVYVLDALKKSIIGTVGIITATSKNCYYVAVDVDKPSSCTNGSSRSGLTNTSIATETERTNGNIELTNIKNKHGVSANTALMLVKAECILGLVLPALHAHKQQHKEHHHQQQAQPQKVSAQDKPRELFTDDSTGVDAAVVGEMNPSAVGGFKYDFNERNSGGRICVMYGKHFMPDCKFV